MLSINQDGFGEFDHTHMIWLWRLGIDEVVFHIDLHVLSQLDARFCWGLWVKSKLTLHSCGSWATVFWDQMKGLVQAVSWWKKLLNKYEQFRVQLWKKIHVGLTSEFDFQDLTLHLLGTLASMHAVRVPGRSSGRFGECRNAQHTVMDYQGYMYIAICIQNGYTMICGIRNVSSRCFINVRHFLRNWNSWGGNPHLW